MTTYSEHRTLAAIVSVLILELTFVSLSMALRMFTRVVILKKTGWEDWILCAAFFILLSTLALLPKAVNLGLLKPGANISLDNVIELGKLSYSYECLNAPAMAFIKVSILLQMIRIFIPIRQTKSYYFIVAFIVFNTMWFIGRFFVTVFQCTPVNRAWNPTTAGYCFNYSAWIFASGTVNMVTNCIMLVLPIFWISRLQMDMKLKLIAGAVFLVGLLACTASIVRFVFSYEYFRSATKYPTVSSLITVPMCEEGEIAAGIVTANLPTIPAFIKYFKAGPKDSREFSEEFWDSGRSRREFDRSELGELLMRNGTLVHIANEEKSRTLSTSDSDENDITSVHNTDFSALPDLVFRKE